ncbi:MAG: glycosyltransferase [Chloroflexota bacterium]|nr:glycosyltransferase [Chloroflexota bacterium]
MTKVDFSAADARRDTTHTEVAELERLEKVSEASQAGIMARRADRAAKRKNMDLAQDLSAELLRARDELQAARRAAQEQVGRVADLDRQVLALSQRYEVASRQRPLPAGVQDSRGPGAQTVASHDARYRTLAPSTTHDDLLWAQDKAGWEAELDQARHEAGAVSRMLRDVLESSCWKLTRPLRQLTELLRGRRWVEPELPGPSWGEGDKPSAPSPEPHRDPLGCIAGLEFNTSSAPQVSIVVPTYGNLGITVQCLRSISAHPPAVPYEVIVVEDASGDPTMGVLAQVPGLVYHTHPRNLGFLLSCNAAADLVRGEFVCFLNNDTEVKEGWADALLQVFENFPACGMVGAKLIFPDGRLQEAGGIIWADGSGWNYGRDGDASLPEFNYVREVDYCSGAAIMLRTEVFNEIGRFDTLYSPAYYEDADLAFRLREHGLRVYYCPRAVVTHYEGVSHGTSTGSGIKAFQVRNQKIFRERWRHVLDRRHYQSGDCVFRAREHARHKRVVLVTDHTIPQLDKDAGSRAMLQTMIRLTRMDLVVKFWPNDHHYTSQFLPLLEDAGIEVVTGKRWDGSFEGYIREVGQQLDFAILSRPNFAGPYLSKLREYSRAWVALFGHDIHHLRMLAQAEVTGDKRARSAALEMKQLEQSLWRAVDSIIYPSQEEADVVADYVDMEKVHAVPLYCFPEDELTLPVEEPGAIKLLFVAGFGHPPNEDAAEWLVSDILPRIRWALPDALLYLVGSNPTARVRALSGRGVRMAPNVTVDELQAHYRNATVAIAPLRFGGGVKLKVVEALASGVPMVTTSVGAQGLPGIEDCIVVADDAQALADAVVELIKDRSRASKLVFAGHDYLREHYSEARMERALWRALSGTKADLEPMNQEPDALLQT